ncbi:hypothetical protein C2845_PM05G01020 [Panicum miliaceum]|uniref:DUF2828 domain-containing protein n=1 Tax=Panicum miliaceum TaxID=4540 RepID=A0A3L6SY91_PANMI|nr:hypothetical protein C2845_PM05G01020 [Panicum miliaceum]
MLVLMLRLPALHEEVTVEFEEMEGAVDVPGLPPVPRPKSSSGRGGGGDGVAPPVASTGAPPQDLVPSPGASAARSGASSLGPATAVAAAAAPTGEEFLDLIDASINKLLAPAAGLGGKALLAAAWEADPATALHLVANLRGVRGSGKSDREGFYVATLWPHARHLHTLVLNDAPVAAFGYLKDLPELLHRVVHGGASTRTPGKKARLASRGGEFVGRRGRGCRVGSRRPHRRANANPAPCVGSTKEHVAAILERDRGLTAAAAAAQPARRTLGRWVGVAAREREGGGRD